MHLSSGAACWPPQDSILYVQVFYLLEIPKLGLLFQTQSQVTNTEGAVSSLDLLPADVANTVPRILLLFPATKSHCWLNNFSSKIARFFQESCFPVSLPSVCIAALVYFIPGARLCICFCWTLWNSCQPYSPGCQSPSEHQWLLPPVGCHLHTCGECSLCHQPCCQWWD